MRFLPIPDRDPRQNPVGAPGEARQHVQRIGLVPGLAEDLVPEHYGRVGAYHDRGPGGRPSERLVPRQPQHHVVRKLVAKPPLIHIGTAGCKFETERRQDFPAPRG